MMPQIGVLQNAVEYILANEGGFVNRPQDHGKATNFGITIDDLAEWRGHAVTVQDVENMEPNEAIEIYWEHYLKPMACDKLNSFAVIACLADCGVLYGTGTAVRYAQAVANGYGYGLDVDGLMLTKSGEVSKTVQALNLLNPKKFVTDFHAQILNRINEIVKADPSQQVFTNGWVTRADKLLSLV